VSKTVNRVEKRGGVKGKVVKKNTKRRARNHREMDLLVGLSDLKWGKKEERQRDSL